MKISRMNLFEGDSKLVAFFDIQTEEGIVAKGFRLINGPNGLFVGAPSEKGKDDKYYDNVILPKELKESLQTMAIDEYNKLKGGSPAQSDNAPF